MISASTMSGKGIITLYHNGSIVNVGPTHMNYNKIVEKMKAGLLDEIEGLVDVISSFKVSFGDIEIVDGSLTYKGHEIKNSLTERIISDARAGKPVTKYINFLQRLLKNPSSRSLNQLYDFIKHSCLRIGDDGCFYAYKGVRTDFMDKYTGKVDNSVGKVVKMERNLISDDPKHACHFGLHVGTIDYARNYCNERLLIVKIDPANVVSVPEDCSCQKCRVCEYEVVAECDNLGQPVCDRDNAFSFFRVGAEVVDIKQLYTDYVEPEPEYNYDGECAICLECGDECDINGICENCDIEYDTCPYCDLDLNKYGDCENCRQR